MKSLWSGLVLRILLSWYFCHFGSVGFWNHLFLSVIWPAFKDSLPLDQDGSFYTLAQHSQSSCVFLWILAFSTLESHACASPTNRIAIGPWNVPRSKTALNKRIYLPVKPSKQCRITALASLFSFLDTPSKTHLSHVRCLYPSNSYQ